MASTTRKRNNSAINNDKAINKKGKKSSDLKESESKATKADDNDDKKRDGVVNQWYADACKGWADFRDTKVRFEVLKEWFNNNYGHVIPSKEINKQWQEFHGRDYRLLSLVDRQKMREMIDEITEFKEEEKFDLDEVPIIDGKGGWIEATFEQFIMPTIRQKKKDFTALYNECRQLIKDYLIPADPYEVQEALRNINWNVGDRGIDIRSPVALCFDTIAAAKSKHVHGMELICIVTKTQIIPWIVWNRINRVEEIIEYPKGPCIFKCKLTDFAASIDDIDASEQEPHENSDEYFSNEYSHVVTSWFDKRYRLMGYEAVDAPEIKCDYCPKHRDDNKVSPYVTEEGPCKECFDHGKTIRAEGSDDDNKVSFMKLLIKYFSAGSSEPDHIKLVEPKVLHTELLAYFKAKKSKLSSLSSPLKLMTKSKPLIPTNGEEKTHLGFDGKEIPVNIKVFQHPNYSPIVVRLMIYSWMKHHDVIKEVASAIHLDNDAIWKIVPAGALIADITVNSFCSVPCMQALSELGIDLHMIKTNSKGADPTRGKLISFCNDWKLIQPVQFLIDHGPRKAMSQKKISVPVLSPNSGETVKKEAWTEFINELKMASIIKSDDLYTISARTIHNRLPLPIGYMEDVTILLNHVRQGSQLIIELEPQSVDNDDKEIIIPKTESKSPKKKNKSKPKELKLINIFCINSSSHVGLRVSKEFDTHSGIIDKLRKVIPMKRDQAYKLIPHSQSSEAITSYASVNCMIELADIGIDMLLVEDNKSSVIEIDSAMEWNLHKTVDMNICTRRYSSVQAIDVPVNHMNQLNAKLQEYFLSWNLFQITANNGDEDIEVIVNNTIQLLYLVRMGYRITVNEIDNTKKKKQSSSSSSSSSSSLVDELE